MNRKGLEQFEFTLSQSSGDSLNTIIVNILESEYINIESLLKIPNVKKIEGNKHHNTLLLFSRGTYGDYLKSKDNYIPLSEAMIKKLRQITLISLFSSKKVYTFEALKAHLDVKDETELCGILFDSFTNQFFKGKIDHKEKLVKITEVKARDYIEDIEKAKQSLKLWIQRIEYYESQFEKENLKLKKETEEYTKYIVGKEESINKLKAKPK